MAQTIKIKRSATSGNKLTGSNSIAGEIGMNTADKSLYIQTGSTDASVVTVYDDSILHLDDTNNRVGIGTTSPSVPLHVNGFARFSDIQLTGTDPQVAAINNTSLVFKTNNTEVARFDASGNLGIGTTAPQSVLDLGNATNGRGISWGGGGGTAHYNTIWSEYSTASIIIGAGLKGATGSATFLNPFTGTYGYAAIELDSFSDDGIKFYTGADASRTKDAAITPTEQMRLDNSGRLGIGTSSPAYQLDVDGTGRFTGAVTLDSTLSFTDTTAANVLDLNNNNIIDVNNIRFADAGPNEGLEWNGGNTKIFESPDDLTTNTAGNLQFVYNGTRRLSVNNTGIDVNGTITGATNISKQVARTATGGTGTEDGPNTWAKLATYSVTNNYNDGTFIYGVVTEEQSLPAAGTIIVRVRWGDLAGSVNPTVKVEWTSKNSGNTLGTDAFKLIGDGVSDDIELWVQKDVSYACVELWELAYRKESNNAVSVSYETTSAWQSSTPTGTAVNETSGTLTFDGKEVLLGDEFNNTTDFKLSGKLNVLASVNTNDAAYIRNSGTGAAFAVNQQGTGDILRVDDNSTTKLIVKDGGNVGIGTTAPEGLMHFSSSSDYDIVFDNTSEEKFRLRHGSSGLYLTGPDTNTLAFGVDQNHDVKMFNTSGSAYATFDGSTSRVGIGTTSPGTKLQISDSATPVLRIEHTGGTARYVDVYNSSGAMYLRARNDTANGNIVFQGGGGGTNTEYARFQGSGNLGIGTTSPQARLHIHNSGTGSGDHAYAHFTTGDTGAGSTDGLTVGIAADGNAAVNFRETSGSLKLLSGNTLQLYTDGTERVTINETGQFKSTGNILVSKDDPTITLLNNSAANTDPNGTIIFSEISGTNNFKINYNGSDDRLEFIGLISSTETDIVYINRSTAPAVNIFGELHVGGHIKTTANSYTISSRKISARDTNGLDLATSDGTSRVTIANNGITTFNATVRADYITGIQQTGSFLDFDDDSTFGSNGVTLSSLGGLHLKFDTNDNDSNVFGVYANGGTIPVFKLTDAGAATFNNAFTFPTSDGSPNQVLKTDGSGNVTWATEAAASVGTSLSDADGDTKIQVEETTDEDRIRFDTAGTQRMVLNELGRLGINTGTPNYLLDIESTSSALLRIYNTGSNVLTSLIAQNDLGTAKFSTQSGYSRIHSGSTLTYAANGTNSIFYSSGTEKMRLTGTGLTIGTATDTTTLEFPDKTGIPDSPTEINDKVQLIKMGQSGYGGMWQTTGRGGMLISSADDSLVLANGDVGRFYDPNGGGHHPAVANETLALLSDFDIRFTTGLQDGWSGGTNYSPKTSVITAEGRFGIGTTSPGEKLEVIGNVEAEEFIGDIRGATLFKASAGEALSKGDVVYISGISGNTTVVSKADADDANKMPAFGIAAAAASANNPVDVYTSGILSGIDTSSFSEGDELFVSTTAGVLTATPPTGESAALQKIGKVTRSASSGSIFIIGAGRSNATPNLNEGKLFVGNSSNQAVADNTVHVDIANSRVGIGTTSPASRLQINGTSADAWNRNIGLSIDGTEHGKIVVDADGIKYRTMLSGDHHFFRNSGNSTTVLIQDDGRVGIGTTSPASKLDVIGDGKFRGTADATPVLKLGQHDNSATTPLVTVYTDDLGSTRPLGGDALEFNMSRYGQIIGATRGSAAGGNVRSWKFTTSTNSNERGVDLILYSQADSSATGSTTTAGNVQLSATSNQDSYINTSGNFGLGTASPSRKFEVHENNTYLTIGEKTGYSPGTYGPILETNSGSMVLPNTVYLADSNAYILKTGTSARLHGDGGVQFSYYNTTTQEGMRLDNSGRLLINTTSSIDNSSKLQIVGDSSGYARITMQDVDGTNQKTFFQQSGGGSSIITQNGTSNGHFDIRGWNGTTTSEFVRVTSTGSMGIGTTVPNTKLHVYENSNRVSIKVQNTVHSAIFEAYGTATAIDSDASNGIFLRLNGANKVHLDSTGHFGIAKDDPGAMLHVQNIYDVTSHPDKTGIRLSRLSGTTQDWLLSTGVASISNSYLAIRDVTNSAYRMVFDTSGDVGIGTTTPDTRLDVTTSGVNGLVLNSDTSATTNSARLFFKASGGTVGMLNVGNSLSFRTGMTIDSTSGTERLNINSTHVASNNTVLLKGANDNSGKADFALNTGGSPTVSLHGTQVQLGSSDQNWNGKISYVSGSGVYFSAWDNDLRLTTSGGASAGARNIRFEPQASGGSSTLRMIVNGDGNVGIGTDSPADRLEIKDNHSQLRLTDSDDNKFVQFSYSGGFLAVRNNNASTSVNLFSLHEDGDFGIGTLSPSSALHVKRSGASSEILSESDTGYATVKLDSATGAGAGVRFLKAGTEKVRLESIPTDHHFQIKMSGTEMFRVTQSGYVGIGTTNPVQKLQVDGNIYANGGRFYVNNNSGISAVGDLVLQTHNGSGYQTSMHLDGADNHVGIGTTTPQQKLTVRGATLFSAGDAGSRHGTEFNWVKSNTGSSGNGVWYKVADISLTNTAYSAMAFEAYYETGLNNFGSHNYLDVREVFVSIVRNSTASTNNSPDSATLRGRTSDIRVYKTAAGTYELQARHNSQNAKYAVRVRVFQTNGGTITPKMDGSTTGTTSGGTEYTVSEPVTTEGVRRYLADIDSSRIHLGSSDIYPSGNGLYLHYSGSGFIPPSTTASSNGSLGTSTYLWNGVFSRRFQGEVGTAGVPTFTFSEDSNTGMYDEWYDQSNSKRQVSFTVDGTRRMHVNEAGVWSAGNFYLPSNGASLRSFHTYTEISNGTSGNGFRMRNSADNVDSLIVTSAGNGTFAGSLTVNGHIDVNGSNIIDVTQINGNGGSGWLDFDMDADSVYPESTTDNQTVLGSITHMNFVGDSNGNGTGGNFYWGYGVGNTDVGTFTQTMSLTRTGDLDVAGALTATTKSFDIEHPTKQGMRLHHGSLEGPEHGVYVRGKSQTGIIELPDYWTGLVDEDTITVQLTAIGKPQELYVEKIEDNKVYVNGENYFYFVQAERKDIEKFEVEYAV